MFSNRRKKQEMKKTVFHNYQLSKLLQPNGPVDTLVKEEYTELHAWGQLQNNIYNTNVGNVGIGIQGPTSALDVSGCVNTTQKYTINYISIAPPVGSIMAYTMNISPDGWLICDGALLNKFVYSGLFGVIGNTFGGAFSDLSFNLPNYCGAFLRGIGSNHGYSGPTDISSCQLHATQTHAHIASSVVTDGGHVHTQASHNHGATTSITDPGHSHTQNTVNDDYNGSGGAAYPVNSPPSFAQYDSAGSKVWNNISSSTTGISASTTINSTTPTINSATTGISVATTIQNSTTSVNANETRPYNFGVYWIIKY
jgi:microcystin-dependent protein